MISLKDGPSSDEAFQMIISGKRKYNHVWTEISMIVALSEALRLHEHEQWEKFRGRYRKWVNHAFFVRNCQERAN